MRVVTEIPHPQFKITVFSWNNKYLIKLEAGQLEQTYKVSEMELTSEDDINTLVSGAFLNNATAIFLQMRQNFGQAMEAI